MGLVLAVEVGGVIAERVKVLRGNGVRISGGGCRGGGVHDDGVGRKLVVDSELVWL
jgi:hypothetical protein